MNVCFGIPSWLPDKEPDRTQRAARLNRLLRQLDDLWPNVDILIIAQNWNDFTPTKTKNRQVVIKHAPLGILGARKALREEFLRAGYDYIIMLDDDAIIECDDEQAPLNFIEKINEHPQGFCFIHGKNSKYHPYIGAQLNLCAISRFIYEREPMVDVDPQKNEGYEDSIFACLLHHKWGEYEFDPPKTIRPVQFQNRNEKVPSTWAEEKRPFYRITDNTNRIQDYIAKNKRLPDNIKDMIVVDRPQPETTADGMKDCFLYF